MIKRFILTAPAIMFVVSGVAAFDPSFSPLSKASHSPQQGHMTPVFLSVPQRDVLIGDPCACQEKSTRKQVEKDNTKPKRCEREQIGPAQRMGIGSRAIAI